LERGGEGLGDGALGGYVEGEFEDFAGRGVREVGKSGGVACCGDEAVAAAGSDFLGDGFAEAGGAASYCGRGAVVSDGDIGTGKIIFRLTEPDCV